MILHWWVKEMGALRGQWVDCPSAPRLDQAWPECPLLLPEPTTGCLAWTAGKALPAQLSALQPGAAQSRATQCHSFLWHLSSTHHVPEQL